tara:strand:- start:1054 stop:1242 length:189 start_codon:yes stop_codon:yes gene_type:complete
MSEKKKKEKKKIPHRIKTQNWTDPQDTEKAAGEAIDKKKKRHNPWGKDATANPENMSAGSGG